MTIRTALKETKDTMDKRINVVLTKADAKDCEHIPQKERDQVKASAIEQLKSLDKRYQESLKHDWTKDFVIDIKNIQDN